MYDKRSSMTAKQARRLLFALATVLLCVALAQQQPKPDRTASYFPKNDPKYGEVISALGDEPKCATVDVNVDDDSASWLPSGGRSTEGRPDTRDVVADRLAEGIQRLQKVPLQLRARTSRHADAEGYGRDYFRQNSTRLS